MKKSYAATEDELGYAEYIAESDAAKTAEDLPWYHPVPVLNATVRGLAEGAMGLGSMMTAPISDSEQREIERSNRKALYEENLPIGNKFLPKAVERASTHVPGIALGGVGPAGTAIRASIAGGLGEAAKELGFGEKGQLAAESIGLIGPDLAHAIPHKRLGSGRINTAHARQNQLADFARSQGLSEEDIALTSGSQSAMRDFLVDFASKGPRTARQFENTRQALGRVWDRLRGSNAATTPLNQQQSADLIRAVSQRAQNLPAGLRQLIARDFAEFIRSPRQGRDIINFWQDLNYNISRERGNRILGTLKEDLIQGIRQISPQLADEFENLNHLYTNFSRLTESMAPNMAEHLLKQGERGMLISGIISRDEGLLIKVLGGVGGRLLARELVINPRVQNLGTRFMQGVRQGSIPVAQRVFDQMVKELAKSNEEAAAELSDFDVESFMSSLPEFDEDINPKKEK